MQAPKLGIGRVSAGAAALAGLGVLLVFRRDGWIAALLLALAMGLGWLLLRLRLRHAAAPEKFFGDLGEETRVTEIKGATHTDMGARRR